MVRMNNVTIKKAAELLGVATTTLRRWEKEGRMIPERTAGGHRRYDINRLLKKKKYENGDKTDQQQLLTIAYARVSSADQKNDLLRQVKSLELYCASKGWNYEIIQDLGSGMNYRKKGLVRLIKLICTNKIERLVLNHKDRLLRFGSDLIFMLCEHFGTEVVIINSSETSSFEEDLTNDVLEIITVFSARLYGSRSHKNKKLLTKLKEASETI